MIGARPAIQFWRDIVYLQFIKLHEEDAAPGIRVYRDSPMSATFQLRGKRGKLTYLAATGALAWKEVRALRDYLTDLLVDVGEEEIVSAPPELLRAARRAYDMLCLAVDTNGGDSKTHSGCEDLRKALAQAVVR